MGCGSCTATPTNVLSCTIANSAAAGGTTSSDNPPALGSITALTCESGYFTSSATACSPCATASISLLVSGTGS